MQEELWPLTVAQHACSFPQSDYTPTLVAQKTCCLMLPLYQQPLEQFVSTMYPSVKRVMQHSKCFTSLHANGFWLLIHTCYS